MVEMPFVAYKLDKNATMVVLTVRLVVLVILVWMLTMHVRSLRVFRWEQSVTGGILVTFTMTVLGLALCAGTDQCEGTVLQAFFCVIGCILFAINAIVLWIKWRKAGELTRVVAELLDTLGLQLRRQVKIKIWMSVAASMGFLIDLLIELCRNGSPLF